MSEREPSGLPNGVWDGGTGIQRSMGMTRGRARIIAPAVRVVNWLRTM